MAKMTKKDYFNMIDEIVMNSGDTRADEIHDFVTHEIDLLARRTSGNRGMTKTQKENLVVMETIHTVLSESEEARTISDLQTDIRLAEFSNQKLSALLRKMIENGEVIKTMNKKKAYFALAE